MQYIDNLEAVIDGTQRAEGLNERQLECLDFLREIKNSSDFKDLNLTNRDLAMYLFTSIRKDFDRAELYQFFWVSETGAYPVTQD